MWAIVTWLVALVAIVVLSLLGVSLLLGIGSAVLDRVLNGKDVKRERRP